MPALLCVLFGLLGIGPTVLARRASLRDAASWLLAPAVGFVIIAATASFLATVGWPIGKWAYILLAAAAGASLFMSVWMLRGDGTFNWRHSKIMSSPHPREDWRWPAIAGVAAALLLSISAHLGGAWFYNLRGYAPEQLDQATLASAVAHTQVSWLREATPGELAVQSNLYAGGEEIFKRQWGAAAVLGWTSVLTTLNPLELWPYYCAFLMLLAVGPVYLIARRLGAGPRWAAVTAVLTATGFWAQFTLDSQSMSLASAMLPALLLLTIWSDAADDKRLNPVAGNRLLIVLATAAIVILHIALIPIVIGGLVVTLIASRLCKQITWGEAARQTSPIAVGLLLALLLQYTLISTIGRQFSPLGMTAAQKSWYAPLFGWLAASPVAGFWGLTNLDAGAPGWWNGPVAALAAVIAAITTTLLLVYLVASLGRSASNVTQRFIAGVIVAGLFESALFLACGQYWSAGQGMLCVAPLGLIVVVGWAAGTGPALFARRSPLGQVLAAGIALFVLCQAWTAILRPALIALESDDLHYISGLPYYRAMDTDMTPIRNALSQGPVGRVGMMIATPDLTRLARLNFAWSEQLIEPLTVQDSGNESAKKIPVSGAIDDWLWEKSLLPPDMPKEAEIARTDSLVLTHSAPFLIDVKPFAYSRDNNTGVRFFWIGRDVATLRINAPAAGIAALAAQFKPGPGLPGLDSRQLEISADAMPGKKSILVSPSTTQIEFPVNAGINSLQIKCTDEPTAQNPGEPVLMLEVVEPTVKFRPTTASPSQ